MHSRFLHASACGLMLATVALADPPDSEDQSELIKALRNEVSELRTTVDELKAAHDPDRELTEARAKEIRGLVNDALADADTRANMLAQGATAGWDKVFFLQSDDGNYRLEINGQFQTRFIVSSQDGAPDGKDRRWGFGIRRAKMSFSGHLFDPSWEFFIQGGFDGAEDGEFELEDALMNKNLGGGLAVDR